MKKFALLFIALLGMSWLSAQDELALIHQTIMANTQEIGAFDPIFLDLSETQQVEVDYIAKMVVEGAEASTVASQINTVAKANQIDENKLLPWVIREASIVVLGLSDNPEARTWTYKSLLETESAAKMETAYQIKDLTELGKTLVSTIK